MHRISSLGKLRKETNLCVAHRFAAYEDGSLSCEIFVFKTDLIAKKSFWVHLYTINNGFNDDSIRFKIFDHIWSYNHSSVIRFTIYMSYIPIYIYLYTCCNALYKNIKSWKFHIVVAKYYIVLFLTYSKRYVDIIFLYYWCCYLGKSHNFKSDDVVFYTFLLFNSDS